MEYNKLTTASRIACFVLLLRFVNGFWQPETRELSEGDYLYDYSEDNGSNSSTTPPPSSEPILSAEAIANIVVTGVAIIFLTSCLCWQMYTFNRVDNRNRVRMALDRNRQIDRQIAAARARQQKKEEQQNEEATQSTSLLVEVKEPDPKLGTDHEMVVRDSPKEVGVRKGELRQFSDPTSGHVTSGESHVTPDEIHVSSSEIVVDLEQQEEDNGVAKESGRDESKGGLLVDVSLGSSDPHPTPVLLVQPAGQV